MDNTNNKQDLFMIFYIAVDGMTRQHAHELLNNLVAQYSIESENFNIHKIWLPVTNQETRVEIINPNLVNGDIFNTMYKLLEETSKPEYKEFLDRLKDLKNNN